MEYLNRANLNGVELPGRIIFKAAGKGSPVESGKMTVAFGRYSGEFGPMAPHRHAEECVYITRCENGWVRFGKTDECTDGKVELTAGTLLHFPENEWHVFEYAEGGFIEAMFIYGQVDNIRPEEKS